MGLFVTKTALWTLAVAAINASGSLIEYKWELKDGDAEEASEETGNKVGREDYKKAEYSVCNCPFRFLDRSVVPQRS